MESLLETLYYEGFSLKGDNKREKEMKRLFAYLFGHEDSLKERMNDEDKITFEKYIDCYSELFSLNGCSEFIAGFQLGGRLVAEIYSGTSNIEFQD